MLWSLRLSTRRAHPPKHQSMQKMENMKEFIALHNRTVSRTQIQEVIEQAKQENNTEVIYRLSKILNEYPNNNRFVINIQNYPQDTTPTALAGTRHLGDYREALDENGRLRKGYKFVKGKIIPTQSSRPSQDNEIAFLAAAGIDYFEEAPDDEPQGLGKPIPAADIYQMITDKIISMLKSTKASDYKKTWEDDAFFIPLNFDSKKPYRGVNRMLLQERIGLTEAFANPYFLTFKQIKKHKGTLKKGAKGYEVVYYSIRYVVPADKNTGRKAYSSTNAHKVIDFIDKHKLPENIVTRIPMIRYYNVYNGEDITGIDFKLPEVKIGRAVPDTAPENQAAQLIVENYPNPPAIKHGGNEAYYKLSEDLVRMPKIEQFDSVNDYYRTLFHELTHSTRHESRLNREKISFRFGDTGYAKEELVAEFGAVFLSAWAGIMWYNNKNHAAYLKGWNSAIKEAESDNKFLMKAASLAQQATDYILNLDAAGQPAFLKKLQGEKAPKKTTDKSAPSAPSTTITNTPTIATTLIGSSTQPTRVRLSVANSKQEESYDKIADKNGFINAEKLKQLLEVWKKDKDFYFEEGFINPADFAKTAPVRKEKGIFTLKNIVSKDELRPTLTGVLIEKDKYVATDAMNLLIVKRPKNDGLKTGTIYDPTPEPQYSKSYRGTAPFADDQTIQNSRYIDGNYPKYENVVNIPNYKVKMFELSPIINTLYASLEIGKRIHTEDYRMVININGKESGYFISVKLLFNALQALKANGSEKAMFLMSKEGVVYTISDNGNIALTVSAKGYDGSVRGHFIQLPIIELTVPKEFVPETKATLNAPTDGTLFGKYPEINTLAFKRMKVTELREFTLEFYRLFLKGKKKEIEKHLKEVVFTSEGGRKIAYGEAMYSAKAAVIEHLDTLIKNSTYNNWGDRKPQDNEDILGYLNFKSKITIDGKKRHVRIAISVDKDRNFKFKSYDIGKKKSVSTHKGVKPFSGGVETLSTNTPAKTVPNNNAKNKKSASFRKATVVNPQDGRNETLSTNIPAKTVPNIEKSTTPPRKSRANPFCGDSAPTNTQAKTMPNTSANQQTDKLANPIMPSTVYVEHLPEETNQQISTSANTLDAKMAALQHRQWETFVIANPQMQAFLGDVERKPAESTVITIAGGAGSGKTRFAFQFINALAQNYKVGHASLEEHPDSKLYYDKVQQYIDNTALPNIEAPEIKNLDQLEALIQRNDVIVIDSFAKLQELNPRFLLDRDLRKKYDGKLFLLIYQLTGEGKMRGGSKSEFDGDIILLTHVAPDYRENYIYPSKNRYNALPATALRYSTYFQQMLDIPQELGTGSRPPEAISLPPAPQTNVYEVIY